MKSLTVLLVGILLAGLLVFPAAATKSSVIIGVGADGEYIYQDVDVNTYSQDGTAVAIGSDITQNLELSIGDKNSYNNDNSVTNYNVKSNPVHYSLALENTNSQIVSLYMGEVYVVKNDIDTIGVEQIQKEGDVYRYHVKSSAPVISYIIDARDVDGVKTMSGAPIYDPVLQKFDHSNIFVYFPNSFSKQIYNHPSRLNWFNFTVPEDGRYALVIDTRVTNSLNGIQTATVVPDTIDIVYALGKIEDGYGTHEESDQVIGTSVMYRQLDDGGMDSTKEIEISH